jgi:sugar-specific transcriptional regulator TrmB
MIEPSETQVRLTGCLKSLGLTKYEALVYIALLRVISATASEIHGISGVPRASVYPVLDQLLEKNLVAESQSSPKRFAAVPPEEGIERLSSRIERDAEYARDALVSIHRERMSNGQVNEELIWNIHGIGNIRSRLIDLVGDARNEIQIIAHPGIFSGDIKSALTRIAERIPVEIVTPQWEGKTSKNMRVYIKRHTDLPHDLSKATDILAGGICIIDKRCVMVIVGSGGEDAVALFSESEGFVRFFSRYYNLIIEWAKKQD